MKKNTLITGATGFVGCALTNALVSDGAHVIATARDRLRSSPHPHANVVVYGDVTNQEFCRRVIADYEVETIYHLAAQSIVSSCAEDPLSALEIAVMGTARLLQAVRDAGRRIRVVVMTTDKVYGAAPSPYTEQTPLDARHAYEVSKACQDLVSRMFHSNYGVDVSVVRAVNIYGPGDPNETRLVPRTVTRLLRGEAPIIHAGAADMRRQYVYVDDLVKALRIIAYHGTAGDAYCVGSADEPLTVADVISEIARQLNASALEPQVRERDARFHEIASQAVDDTKLRTLGWAPQVSFAEGIRRTIAWYANHRATS